MITCTLHFSLFTRALLALLALLVLLALSLELLGTFLGHALSIGTHLGFQQLF